jgi:hypothetical protein
MRTLRVVMTFFVTTAGVSSANASGPTSEREELLERIVRCEQLLAEVGLELAGLRRQILLGTEDVSDSRQESSPTVPHVASEHESGTGRTDPLIAALARLETVKSGQRPVSAEQTSSVEDSQWAKFQELCPEHVKPNRVIHSLLNRYMQNARGVALSSRRGLDLRQVGDVAAAAGINAIRLGRFASSYNLDHDRPLFLNSTEFVSLLKELGITRTELAQVIQSLEMAPDL